MCQSLPCNTKRQWLMKRGNERSERKGMGYNSKWGRKMLVVNEKTNMK